jgi:DNA-binding SARP family transcriptional activator
MNTEKQVFNKLFSKEKVELASQAYEFALADDIKAAAKALADAESNVKQAKSKAMEAIGNYNQWANGGISRANAVIRLVDDLIAKSKELGVDPPQNMVALKQEASAKSKLYSSNLSAATAASKTILQ